MPVPAINPNVKAVSSVVASRMLAEYRGLAGARQVFLR